MKIFIVIITLCCIAPIWLYLLYKILVAVQASELMWFLYYIYVPATTVLHLLIEAVRKES